MIKVLIVDDEPIISHGLVNFIDWHSLDCEIVGEAENGLEAIKSLDRNPPDIIISDVKMPGLDGIGLAKYLYESHPEIKIIILTGYADFSYAQTAIQFGVIEFIVKPAFTEKIIDAIEKAKRILLEEERNRNRLITLENKANQHLVDVQKKLIHDVITGVLTDSEKIRQKAESMEIRIGRYYLLVFQMSGFSEEKVKDLDMINHSMCNLIALVFQGYRLYSASINKNTMCQVITFDVSKEPDCIQKIINHCEEILNIANNYLQFTITIGISNMYTGLETLESAYIEACNALEGSFYDQGNIYVFSPHVEPGATVDTQSINKRLQKIALAIQNGDSDEAVQEMHAFIAEGKEHEQAISTITSFGINLCASCSQLLSNFNLKLESVLGLEKQESMTLYKQIVQCDKIARLEDILEQVIRATTVRLKDGYSATNNIVNNAKEYILAHYCENIRLQMIAEYAHVNNSYLSRLFKKETGETITEIINRLRVEKAKALLLNKDIKTYEVASMVGICDSTYFSQVFKKQTGISPTEYRYFNGN